MIKVKINRENIGFPPEFNQILLLLPERCGMLSDRDYEDYRWRYMDYGYELVYLPRLMESIPRDVVDYFVPEIGEAALYPYEVVQSRILGDTEICLCSPTAVMNEHGSLVAVTTSKGDEDTGEFLDLLLEYLRRRMRIKPLPPCPPCESAPYIVNLKNEDIEHSRRSRPESTFGMLMVEPAYDEAKSIEKLIDELKSVKESSLRSLGLTEDTLRFILGRTAPKLSRMRITRHAKIILEDYAGREIKMDDKTKALYFLFLRHEEGIAIKDLPMHVDELMDLYQSLSGRDDPKAMRQTIENLADPFQNNANISLSRIKKAFCEAFSPTLAAKYFVEGERGGVRRIALDRSLVIWETIR